MGLRFNNDFYIGEEGSSGGGGGNINYSAGITVTDFRGISGPYPFPSDGYIAIRINNLGFSAADTLNIRINGKTIYEFVANSTYEPQNLLDTTHGLAKVKAGDIFTYTKTSSSELDLSKGELKFYPMEEE